MFTENQLVLQTLLANDLVPSKAVSFATSIANYPKASPKQLFHVDRIVRECGEKVNEPKVPLLDVSKIFTLFTNAQKHLKYPKITLRLSNGAPCRLSYSKKWNAVFGAVGGFGSTSYGKILPSGEIISYVKSDTHMRTAFAELVAAFAADPVALAAEHGKLNHNCCYCSKALDTPESLAVGYGKICAKHYGLPWGKDFVATKPNVKQVNNWTPVVTSHVDTLTAGAALDYERNLLLDDGNEDYFT